MSISAKRVLLPLVAVAFVAAISAIGFYLGKRAPAPMAPPIAEQPAEQQDSRAPAPRIIDAPYHIAQPTMGYLNQTQRLDLSVNGLHAAAAANDAVRVGMDVILYDAQGFALPDKARVAQSDENGIRLEMPDYINVPVRAEVIVAQDNLARRLPLSARTGNSLWKATPYPDGSVVLSRVVLPDNYLHNDTLFHISDGLRADEYAILDPSDDLREGDVLSNVYPSEFDAPSADDAQLARSKIETLRTDAMFFEMENDRTPPAILNNPETSCEIGNACFAE